MINPETKIIDGVAVAAKIQAACKERTAALLKKGIHPVST